MFPIFIHIIPLPYYLILEIRREIFLFIDASVGHYHYLHMITIIITLLPLVTGPFNSFLKPSQLHGEYTVCATIKCATWLNQSQEPCLASQVPIHSWVERSNYYNKMSCLGTQVSRLLNPHSAEQKVQCSYLLGHNTLQLLSLFQLHCD